MLFNSLFFIGCFWPLVAAVFFLLGRMSQRAAALWLCAASIFFYGWWNVNYVWLLIASVLFNYGAGYLIGHACGNRTKSLLTVAIAGDLLLLGYYKYAGFFVQSAERLLGADWTLIHIVLPLGISFFTFTQIAFLVDTYRGKAREYDFIHYLLFVTYFPHLIAGPILHHAQMMPQFALRQTYRVNWDHVARGITIFIIGLGKKVFLADGFSTIASPLFQDVAGGAVPALVEAWIGALAYTLQLYFDFSGYCDMAIGISLLFNIRLPLNFNSPYKAVNIIDFWRRWHMTLSAFLRDYLYIPLGGNRKGPSRRYVNLLATMLLGGLWHGAGWTFVVWGGLHGFYLVINHAFHAFREGQGWREGRFGFAGRALAIATTFVFVVIAWVFFRAPDFSTASRMIMGMVGANGISLYGYDPVNLKGIPRFLYEHGVRFEGFTPVLNHYGSSIYAMVCKLSIGVMIVWGLPNTQEWMRFSPAAENSTRSGSNGILEGWQPKSIATAAVFGTLFALAVLTLASGGASEFLYFQF